MGNLLHTLPRKVATLLVLCACLLHPSRSHCQETVTAESLKAAFLVHLLGYVEWPASHRSAPYTICLITSEDQQDAIETYLQKKNLHAKVRVRDFSSRGEPDACHLLFVEEESVHGATFLFKEAQRRQTLSIGSGVDAIARGGMLRISQQGKKISFEINLKAVNAAGIRLDSRLMPLAGKIYR